MTSFSVPVVNGAGQTCTVHVLSPAGSILPNANPAPTTMSLSCPTPPSAAGPAAPPAPSAAQVARQWSTAAALPRPSLTVRPGYAVTGLLAFLEITTPDPWMTSFTDPIRSDTISVACTHTGFEVDWGDGTSLHTTSVGGPYPAGDVTHIYANASPGLTLAVTEQWTCRWNDQLGNAGTIPGLRSLGTKFLEVREIRSFSD